MRLFYREICYCASIDREIAVPGYEEIKAARAVLTDDCIVDIQRGVAPAENIIKRMLEAAEKVRSSGAHATAEEWDQPHLWPARPADK
jgi:hypothetical protein